MIYRAFFPTFFLGLLLATGFAHGQQYRWIDKDGRVQFTDAPPPPWAKDVRKSNIATTQPEVAPVPFELARLQKDFPVTLYTAPGCKEPCTLARDLLNKRSVPFKEVQVWNAETLEQLKKVAATENVPVLVVGRSTQNNFDPARYDSLLDSAGYPAAGAFPPRSQAAPALPDGFEPPPAAEPTGPSPSPTAQKPGPYDASGLTGPPPKPGQYDPSGLVGPPPKPGQYGLPVERK